MRNKSDDELIANRCSPINGSGNFLKKKKEEKEEKQGRKEIEFYKPVQGLASWSIKLELP